jgi:hypothetical protein
MDNSIKYMWAMLLVSEIHTAPSFMQSDLPLALFSTYRNGVLATVNTNV